MDKTRKLSTVVFYQPDEEAVLSRPGEGPAPTLEEVTSSATFQNNGSSHKRPSLIITRKKAESEDSGVKSEEDGCSTTQSWQPRSNSRWSRFSRNISLSSTSQPFWDFPSFDELFDNGGKARFALHRSPTSISDVIPRSPTSTSSLGGESVRLEEESVTSATSGQPTMGTPQPVMSRQDSIMSQSFRSLLFKSWEGSQNDFISFRSRLGGHVRHKYCMCCRITSTPFLFVNVALGMFITCLGVLCFIHCRDELMMSVYVLINGLLSVFFFPTVIMAWNKRIGGCVNESKKEEAQKESPAFFIVALTCRIASTIIGTTLLVYRHYWVGPSWENTLCEVEFFMTCAVVVIEWIFLVIFLTVPMIIYFCLYRVAPYLSDSFEDE
ncbi:uncharacterized protein LOC117334601 [Pecten maximus]|uniref:uncharacterized protein LOC117334601 n=1 Tax=Pecten maximus TaxID=6579 RepID=UPI0014587883|nr:uncharacterized protein LOC117334601 [Pecten maximus]